MLGNLDHQACFQGGVLLPGGRRVALYGRIAFGDGDLHRQGQLDPDHLFFENQGANALEVVHQVAGFFTEAIDRQGELVVAVHVHEVKIGRIPVEELDVSLLEVRLDGRIPAAKGLVDLLLGPQVPRADLPDGIAAA